MGEVKTCRELHSQEPQVGYEWDAGYAPPGEPSPGRWTVKRTVDNWLVLFHSLIGAEYTIQSFSPTEEGERFAKYMALRLVQIAWETQAQGGRHGSMG